MIDLTCEEVIIAIRNLLNPNLDMDFIYDILSIIRFMRSNALPLIDDLWDFFNAFDDSLRSNVCVKINISTTIDGIEGESCKVKAIIKELYQKLRNFK